MRGIVRGVRWPEDVRASRLNERERVKWLGRREGIRAESRREARGALKACSSQVNERERRCCQ